MPVDRVAENMALLEIANREGSLNNEDVFRTKLEKFQNRFREHKPSVIDVSTDAEKLFREDIEILRAVGTMSQDREMRTVCSAFLRCLLFLARTKENG